MIENAGIDYKELYLQMQSAVVALSKTLEEIQKENKNLKEENEYLKRKLFGTKSETSKSLGFEQLSLFDEAEAKANPDEEQFILEEVKFNKKKKYKGQLDDKLSKLPHIEVIMTLPESELVLMRQKQKQIQTKNNLFLKKLNSIKRKSIKGSWMINYLNCHISKLL